ncbi:MAG: GGDEF domain-containing response regulator [Desulforudis sp.]|jgi:diguanylate cyclase (GGDEF)-like protein/PAS domain S-box-containing protein|nr:MAG: GGDEF domain-containing response regulator [Desulforudis sp.]
MTESSETNDKPLILIVDDSRYLRLKLRQVLEGDGYTVAEAEDGQQALSIFKRFQPDLVLMDCVMPVMNGLSACAQMQAFPGGNRTPVIMITGLSDDNAVDDAFNAGATDYITKPIHWAVLRNRVRRLMRARQTEASLDKVEALARSIISRAHDGIITVDTYGVVKSFNPACERIFGYAPGDVIGQNINVLLPDFHDKDGFIVSQLIGEDEVCGVSSEVVGRRNDGSAVPIEFTFSDFCVHRQCFVTLILRDITERKRYEETIWHQAFHDNLTGLANRMLFKDRLALAMAHAKRNNNGLAVLFLDLDRFKLINDTLGHDIGDQLLNQVGIRLRNCVREDDTVARMGGDEFTLLLPEIMKAEHAARIAQKVVEAVRQPLKIGEHELYISTSIGIVLFPDDGQDAETLLKNADTAMYRAKENGRNHYELYASSMNAKASERLSLENSMRRALERREFVVHYQPKINVKSGGITGMEALVRWQHPKLGLVLPGEFIPLAEESGLIVPIGEWVLKTACAQNKAWQDSGFPSIRVAVNLSARQFQLQNLVEVVSRVLKTTGLDPTCLELEITESIAMQNAEHTVSVLNQLNEMGIQLSIDDFGTGYSSLSYLRRFPINKLKIDRSFVAEIGTDSHNGAIASAVIVLGRSLNMGVIAEGVEREEQLNFLKDHDCFEMQGFLFGKPMPVEDFTHFLMAQKQPCNNN